MDSKVLFAKAIDQTGSCVRQVKAEHLGNATPCSEWDLRALLNHMVYELRWVPDILRGKTIGEVGDRYDGDTLRSDFRSAWQHAADTALVAVHRLEDNPAVHLSYGDVPASDYLAELSVDIFVHGWDASHALNYSLVFQPDACQAVYEWLLPRRDSLAASGLFAEPVDVSDGAAPQVRLLAITGREAGKA